MIAIISTIWVISSDIFSAKMLRLVHNSSNKYDLIKHFATNIYNVNVYGTNSAYIKCASRGLVVSIPASQAGGREFKPR